MFLSNMFLVCFGSMVDIVIVDTKFMHKFAKWLAQYSSELSGRHYVSMVLICFLPVDGLYILVLVVGHECDTLVESFIVHSLIVEQVGPNCEWSQALFLIFLSNVPYV